MYMVPVALFEQPKTGTFHQAYLIYVVAWHCRMKKSAHKSTDKPSCSVTGHLVSWRGHPLYWNLVWLVGVFNANLSLLICEITLT